MDSKKVDEAKAKLKEINDIVSSFEPEIRAGAFDILARYYFGDNLPKKKPKGKAGQNRHDEPEDSTDSNGNLDELEDFVRQFDHSQEKNNVHAIAAWYYSQYGLIPVTTKMIKESADHTGLRIPTRPDNTMKVAGVKGKRYYMKTPKGFKPTPFGEKFFTESYSVRKGKKKYSENNE